MVRMSPFGKYAPFFDELVSIYADMDRLYNKSAEHYGFHCAGCDDNCCMTRFYHHTHIEQLYLLNGFLRLGFDRQEYIRNRAKRVNQQILEADSKEIIPRVMCALNDEGLCCLYSQRPMICRLHGIPHEFTPPGRDTVFGSGCAEFVRQCGDKGYRVFDRTPFYLALAGLEQRFKDQFGFTEKIKKTVSEMLALD